MLKLKSVNFNHQLFQDHTLVQAQADQLEWFIGRDPRCHLVFKTLDVSRTHGRIFYDNDYFFENMSQHGSLHNSEELLEQECRPLKKGDLIVLGETYLHIEELGEPLSVATEQLTHWHELDRTPTVSLSNTNPLESSWTGDLRVRCCRIIQETSDVKTFCFLADPPILFHYQPGQFVNLAVEIDGKTVLRPYSISSSPTRPHHLAITIKRLPGSSHDPALDPDLPPGLVSNWMHDHFSVGDFVNLQGGVFGNFTCLPNVPPKLLLLSAGSGITPMMSMARWLQDTLTPSDIVFLHSARTPSDIIFRRELEAMAAQMPNFRLAIAITRPVQSSWMGLTGRISQSMLQLVVPDLSDRVLFVCGSHEFRQTIRSILEATNFPMEAYHEESFGERAKVGYNSKSNSAKSNSAKSNSAKSNSAKSNGKVNQSVLVPNQPKKSNSQSVDSIFQEQSIESLANPASSQAGSTPEVSFAKSGITVPVDSHSSVLELAELEGISLPSACRVGACGACKVRVLQGKVQYQTKPVALTDADCQAGYMLTCVGYASDRLVVDA